MMGFVRASLRVCEIYMDQNYRAGEPPTCNSGILGIEDPNIMLIIIPLHWGGSTSTIILIFWGPLARICPARPTPPQVCVEKHMTFGGTVWMYIAFWVFSRPLSRIAQGYSPPQVDIGIRV